MFDFESARQRDGDAEAERSDEVDEIVGRDRLGRNEGRPLVGDDYSEYPRTDELAHPESRAFVEALFDHDLVGSIDDAVAEFTASNGSHAKRRATAAFQNATDLFDVEITEASEPQGDRLDDLLELTDYEGPAEGPLLVAVLYADLGLSVEEVAEVSDRNEGSVRGDLADLRLLDGDDDTDPEEFTGSNARGRLGGGSVTVSDDERPGGDSDGEESGGLTVHTSDF